MFEDPQNPTPPANLPTGHGRAPEPEDIFEKVEPAQTPPRPEFPLGRPVSPPAGPPPSVKPAAAPEAPTPPAPTRSDEQAMVKGPIISSRKVIVALGVILAVAILGVIVWGVMQFVKRTATPPELPASSSAGAPGAPAEEGSVPEVPEIPSLPPAAQEGAVEGLPGATVAEPAAEETILIDTDGDGLRDADEEVYGTQSDNPDSDNDGLLDGEEVKTYQTDPLDPDTDGDGYLDGQEVRGNYNPNGPGPLFSLPSQ